MTHPSPSKPTLSEKSGTRRTGFRFAKGKLARQIALRGLSQKQFAAQAELDAATILKAIRGEELQAQSWGKILIALGAVPVPEIPTDLVERTA